MSDIPFMYCRICGGRIETLEEQFRDHNDVDVCVARLGNEITRLRSLLTRMQSVGDEALRRYVHIGETSCWCLHCDADANYSFENSTWLCTHAPSCPVTKWQELKKEMEG